MLVYFASLSFQIQYKKNNKARRELFKMACAKRVIWKTKFRKKVNFTNPPVILPNASVKPEMYNAHEKTLATKNRTPMLPPNSGPNVRLIMSKKRKFQNSKNRFLWMLNQIKKLFNAPLSSWKKSERGYENCKTWLTVHSASLHRAVGRNSAKRKHGK